MIGLVVGSFQKFIFVIEIEAAAIFRETTPSQRNFGFAPAQIILLMLIRVNIFEAIIAEFSQ